MQDLEYKVGGLDPTCPTDRSKFLVVREEERTLVVYALAADVEHRHVVRNFRLDERNILGGGIYAIDSSILWLYGYSTTYRSSVLPEAAQEIGNTLAEHFRRNGTQITKVEVDMPLLFDEPSLEKWRALGFEIPEGIRVLD